MVSALAPGWPDQCVACAAARQNFTVLFATAEDLLTIEKISRHFGYSVFNLGNAIGMVPANPPAAPAAGAANTNVAWLGINLGTNGL